MYRFYGASFSGSICICKYVTNFGHDARSTSLTISAYICASSMVSDRMPILTAYLSVIAMIVYMFLTSEVFAVGVNTSFITGGRHVIIIFLTSFFISVVKNDWKINAT